MLLLLCFFFGTKPRDWLGRTSPKWHILCRVGCKTLTQSIKQSSVNSTCISSKLWSVPTVTNVTDRVNGKGNAVGCTVSVCSSVCLFPLCLLNWLTFELDFCTCMAHDHRWPGLKVKVIVKVNAIMFVPHQYLLRRPMSMSNSMRFYCRVISDALARRGVRRGAVEASGSGGVQRVWAW